MDLRCNFLVVTMGKPSLRSKRIWYPKTLSVPVPVRSFFRLPLDSTCFSNSWYCFMSLCRNVLPIRKYESFTGAAVLK